MPQIHLTTFIQAPPQRVFDLARSITLHRHSMAHTGEEAIDGITQGLINLNETVTWQGKHLFKKRIMKSAITAMQPYLSFTDEMVAGDFKMMKHEHHFKAVQNGTIMIDLFTFETPYASLGRLLNTVYLTRYLKKQLEIRNQIIKEYAESNKWKDVLETESKPGTGI